MEWPEDYCDYCEKEGHTFRKCPARDDNFEDMDIEQEAKEYDRDN